MDDVARQSEGKSDSRGITGESQKPADLRSGAALLEEAPPASEVLVMQHSYLDRISELTQQKDGAYAERNQVLALLARMAVVLGWKVGIGQHPAEDATWEKDWRTILFIDAPTGQCSWHFHDSEVHLLSGLPFYDGAWDGHTTQEKYWRVERALRGPGGVVQAASPSPRVVELARSAAADIEENRRVSEEAMAKLRAGAHRFVEPLSLPQHEEVIKAFGQSLAGAASRESYMKQHGLAYVEGVLHWERDVVAPAPWSGPWPRPFGYSPKDWAQRDEESRGLVWFMRMSGGFMGRSGGAPRTLADADLELRQHVAKQMEKVRGFVHSAAYISQTDCGRQISDYPGLQVERRELSRVTCLECRQVR